MTKNTLFFSPQPTRSARARWAFIEAGLSFAPEVVDIFQGEHKTEKYLAVNPLGIVPAANIDGETILESSALALIAAQESKNGPLVPETGSAAWKKAMQWVVFAPAEIDHHLAVLNQHRLLSPPDQRDESIALQKVERIESRLAVVSKSLEGNDYLLGKQFSVADICVGHCIVWCQMHDLIKDHAQLRPYLSRLEARPAFKEVYGGKVEVYPDPFKK